MRRSKQHFLHSGLEPVVGLFLVRFSVAVQHPVNLLRWFCAEATVSTSHGQLSLTHRKQAVGISLTLADYFRLHYPSLLLSLCYHSVSLSLRDTTSTSQPAAYMLKIASFDKDLDRVKRPAHARLFMQMQMFHWSKFPSGHRGCIFGLGPPKIIAIG